MRVLLINPATIRNNDPLSVPLGLLSIGTYLKHQQHTVKIYESGANRNKFSKVFKRFSPDIIGVSVISGKSVKDALAISKYAKKTGKTVVWGGFLPSVMPELILKTGYVDIVSIGEGENTWHELLEAIENGKPMETVKGLAYLENNRMVVTQAREMTDLASIPVIDFELADIKNYFYSYYYCKRAINLYSSKGCSGHCTFCYNSDFNNSTHRARPVEHVMEEIYYLANNYDVDGIIFNDDLIFGNTDEMYRFCTAINEYRIKIHMGLFRKDRTVWEKGT